MLIIEYQQEDKQMPRNEGNAQGRHFTEQDKVEDEDRNYTEAHGRRHFAPNEEQKAGGHSDRWADASSPDNPGLQHDFRHEGKDDDVNAHDKPQDQGRMQGEAHNEGRHQGGRNRKNSR